jgi:hypothetical protein
MMASGTCLDYLGSSAAKLRGGLQSAKVLEKKKKRKVGGHGKPPANGRERLLANKQTGGRNKR